MAKRAQRSAEWYRLALLGNSENPGLREVARGFGSRDGMNLREGLTPAQKRKITIAFHELQSITAQPRYVYKPKNQSKKEKDKLTKALKVTQSDTKTNWKVAFIPHVPKKLKNGKLSKPRIRFGKTGVTIGEAGFSKIFIPLDPLSLVRNSQREILRAIKVEAPKAQRFTVQAGANEMPVLSDKAGVVERVKSLMMKYDGKTALPKSSGNAGNAPKYHKWDQWLHGLVGYQFPKASAKNVSDAVNTFDKARTDLQKKRRAAREKARYNRKKKR